MPSPRIAAVIPAYNAAATIRAAIESVLAQQHPADEIIVVDDGSVDETARIAEATGARVIRQANAGPAAARNVAIAATSAEWIALLDADDRWRPEKLAKQLPLFGGADIAVVYSGAFTPEMRPLPPPKMDFDSLWERNRIGLSTVLLRRSAWESVGGFESSRKILGVDDYNLWLRLAHAGWQFVGIPERLTDYEPSATSLTRQRKRFAKAEIEQLSLVAKTLGIDPTRLKSKEFDKYLEYGLELFHFRDLLAAREYLGEAARRGRLPTAAKLRWLATFIPLPRSRKS